MKKIRDVLIMQLSILMRHAVPTRVYANPTPKGKDLYIQGHRDPKAEQAITRDTHPFLLVALGYPGHCLSAKSLPNLKGSSLLRGRHGTLFALS